MWVMTQDGFYSVVAYDPSRTDGHPVEGEDLVVVRARAREDLEVFGKVADIIDSPTADYPFRVVIERTEWQAYLERAADEIDYTNFKSRVSKRQGHRRHDVYMKVWGALHGITDRVSTRGPSWIEAGFEDVEEHQA